MEIRHYGPLNDVLETGLYTEENDISGILFSVDFEKAFESIEHTFLFAFLKSFGFGLQFIQQVRTLLNNAESCVVNNGHSTGYFPSERGTRQGDPLSAYLFILRVESLFIQIRKDKNIKGIVIGDHEIKLSAYADDADLTLDVKSLQTILQYCTTFQLYSSLKLNLDKSEACWIRTKRGAKETPVNCRCVNLNCSVIRTFRYF